MQNFTEIIRIDEKKYIFYFRKNVTIAVITYFVETMDGEESINFQMQLKNGKWKTKGPVPVWIKKKEDKLGEAIEIRESLNI